MKESSLCILGTQCFLPQPDKAGLEPTEQQSGSSTTPSQPGWEDAARMNYRRTRTLFLRFAATTFTDILQYSHTVRWWEKAWAKHHILLKGIYEAIRVNDQRCTWQTTLAGSLSRLRVFLSYHGSNMPSRCAMSFVLSPVPTWFWSCMRKKKLK